MGLLSVKGAAKTGVGRCVDHLNCIFEGQIKAGRPHGFGRKIFANGSYYIGLFSKGSVHGFGTIYSSDDVVLEQGNWVNGEMMA